MFKIETIVDDFVDRAFKHSRLFDKNYFNYDVNRIIKKIFQIIQLFLIKIKYLSFDRHDVDEIEIVKHFR